MSKKNVLSVTLWTNADIEVSANRFGSVLSTVNDDVTEVRTVLCSSRRHQRCSRSKRCARLTPNSDFDIADMFGLGSADNVRKPERDKIKRLLDKRFAECRKVCVSIEVCD